MQTKRDQVQAHLFVVGRLVSALVRSEPDAPQTPMRRSVTGLFAGVMIAVVVLAGFAVFGLVRPGGSKAFKEPGTIIVEKETGSRFLLIDGQLRPVLNVTSARLIAGATGRVRSVSRRSLAGVPHGGPIGIPAAPDSLPDPARLSFGPWLVCSPTGRDTTGGDRSVVTVSVGVTDPVPAMPADRAALLRTPDGAMYLAWQNRRLRIPTRTALLALGYGNEQPFPVAASWVNALPAGPDLTAPPVAGRGRPGPTLAGTATRVGQIVLVRGGGAADAFYLVARDGVAPLSQTDAALLLGDPASAVAYPGQMVVPIELSAATVAAARVSATRVTREGFPPAPPPLVERDGSGRVPCVRAVFGSTESPDLQVALVDAEAHPGVSAAGDLVAPGPLAGGVADRVTVPAGGGLVVQEAPAPGVGGALYLITDLGVKYPLPSTDVAGVLGYGGAAPVPVPGPTLAFLPTGPVLDPEAAKTSQPAVSVPPGD